MKIILFSRPRVAHVDAEIAQIFEAIARYGFDYSINDEFSAIVERVLGVTTPTHKIYSSWVAACDAVSVMVCYGGDVTLLAG